MKIFCTVLKTISCPMFIRMFIFFAVVAGEYGAGDIRNVPQSYSSTIFANKRLIPCWFLVYFLLISCCYFLISCWFLVVIFWFLVDFLLLFFDFLLISCCYFLISCWFFWFLVDFFDFFLIFLISCWLIFDFLSACELMFLEGPLVYRMKTLSSCDLLNSLIIIIIIIRLGFSKNCHKSR